MKKEKKKKKHIQYIHKTSITYQYNRSGDQRPNPKKMVISNLCLQRSVVYFDLLCLLHLKSNNLLFIQFVNQPTNEIGAGVPFSDSAISKSMRSSETDSQIATRKGEGLYVATTQPPSQV